MNRTILNALAGIALAGTPMLALQAQSGDGSRIVTEIDVQELASSLSEMGATWERSGDESESIAVTFENGGKAILRPTACRDGPCMGLLMVAFFSKPDGMSQAEADEIARQFNMRYNPASVVKSDNGNHVLKAYLIFDYGITKQNLTFRLGLFGSGIMRYNDALNGGG
ncbi:hypothetical protein ACI5KX_08175 [Erythrobacter sp. GH1-10]|uniref:hypothetical protein n=1 Tax=Erythrobacter sp. GH1-10 TaxID=3349334 RepID=UPI003877B301